MKTFHLPSPTAPMAAAFLCALSAPGVMASFPPAQAEPRLIPAEVPRQEAGASLIYARDLYLAIGASGVVLLSEDAEAWKARNSGISSILHRVDFGGGLFYAAGANRALLRSRDGQKSGRWQEGTKC